MLQVSPYKYSNAQVKPQSIKPRRQKIENGLTENQKTVAGLAGLAVLGVTAYVIARIKTKSAGEKSLEPLKELMALLNTEMQEFPQDIAYRSKIAKAIGLSDAQLPSLRSIIGMEEYKNIIREFGDSPFHYTPGKVLINLEKGDDAIPGVINKTFRATFHMHTNNSDGSISIQELLDQGAKYADEVAASFKANGNVKAKHAPFTIAITDHDTVEGCKEAVKIISSNPEKYKNLRVVLGCEMSVQNRLLGSEMLRRPVENHIVVNCLNPFDEGLNKFLDKRKQARIPLGRQAFEECLKRIRKLKPELAAKMSYDDAVRKEINLGKGLLNVYCPLNSYFSKRIKKEKLSEDETKKLLQSVYDITDKYLSKMEKSPTDTDFSDLVELFKDREGYLTWAHPAMTDMAEFLKRREDSVPAIGKLFGLMKEKAGEKFLAAEIYYPYFGELGHSTEWLKLMEVSAKANGLYFTGGLDFHGKNIFYPRRYR